MMTENRNVLVVGASDKPERKSNTAVSMLKEYGYNPIPVHPRALVVHGIKSLTSIDKVTEAVDTVTLYVNAQISSASAESLIRCRPRRVIFNPGAENPELKKQLEKEGIETIEACTLVMLRTKQF